MDHFFLSYIISYAIDASQTGDIERTSTKGLFHPLYWSLCVHPSPSPLSNSISSLADSSSLLSLHPSYCAFRFFSSSNTILTGIFIHTQHTHTHTPSDQLSEVLPSTTVTVTFLFLFLLTERPITSSILYFAFFFF